MSFPLENAGPFERLKLYLAAAHGDFAGWFKDAMVAAAGWAPGLAGLLFRAFWDRFWIRGSGRFAVERGVRILGAKHLAIEDGVYLDRGVYLHGRPGGLTIGPRTRVMSGAVLHVYNFRDLPGSGISIGADCVIGIDAVITGQGGVVIEDRVIVAPKAMILPVDHNFGDPASAIREQGIRARGVRICRGAWIGAGAIILDGTVVGENAVVGAGAVVTAEVAPGAVVAGNPARELRPQTRREEDGA